MAVHAVTLLGKEFLIRAGLEVEWNFDKPVEEGQAMNHEIILPQPFKGVRMIGLALNNKPRKIIRMPIGIYLYRSKQKRWMHVVGGIIQDDSAEKSRARQARSRQSMRTFEEGDECAAGWRVLFSMRFMTTPEPWESFNEEMSDCDAMALAGLNDFATDAYDRTLAGPEMFMPKNCPELDQYFASCAAQTSFEEKERGPITAGKFTQWLGFGPGASKQQTHADTLPEGVELRRPAEGDPLIPPSTDYTRPSRANDEPGVFPAPVPAHEAQSGLIARFDRCSFEQVDSSGLYGGGREILGEGYGTTSKVISLRP